MITFSKTTQKDFGERALAVEAKFSSDTFKASHLKKDFNKKFSVALRKSWENYTVKASFILSSFCRGKASVV